MLIAEHLAADNAVLAGQLRQAKERAEADLTAAIARRDQAQAAMREPEKAEERAARDVEDAQAARGKFDLAARKAERRRMGAEAIVRARQALAIADEELATRTAALAAARGERLRAEALLSEADADLERLTAARDHAARRFDAAPQAAMSIDTMNAIAAPVLAIAKEVASLRLGNPANQFTPQDVAGSDLVAFTVGLAAQLGALTGLMSAEHAAGTAAGREQAEAERDSRPRVVGDTVVSPGSRNVRGGIFAPGWAPR